MKKNKIIECDWIRALAAIAVIFYHYTMRYPALFETKIDYKINFTYGSSGVNIFFLLSGFLTLYALKPKAMSKEYLKKRIKRLYPEYWICLIITGLIEIFFLKELFPGLKAFIINFSMLQNFIGVSNIDGAYWTLAYEIRFYIVIFLLILIKKIKKITPICYGWMGIIALQIFLYNISGETLIVKLLDYVFMPSYAAPFIIGIFLFNLTKNIQDKFSWIGILSAVFISYIEQEKHYCITLVVFTIIFIIIIVMRWKVVKYETFIAKIEESRIKPLSFIAKISYPMYLLHQYIGYVILQQLEKLGFHKEIMIIIPFIIIVLLSYCVNQIIRKVVYHESFKKFMV